VGWFRDLLMLAFSLLMLVIAGLLVTHSGFAVAPMDGSRSLLPLSLIIIATTCMLFTQRHWTTLSYRRALLSLVISLAVAFVIARGCIEGVTRRDGVFLRTAKAGGHRTIFTALKLARWETGLALALYLAAGLLAGLAHKPWLLIFLIFMQATVFLCAPIASIWNHRAQGARGQERQRGFAERRLRAERRRRARALLPRPAAAALTALCVGGVTSAFVAPAALLHATAKTAQGVSAQSLLASGGTEVLVRVGSSSTKAGRTYYPVTSMHLSEVAARSAHGPAQTELSFDTSSLALLGEVLQAAEGGSRTEPVSLAFRAPGADGRPATELAETFADATVVSMSEQLSGTPKGTVSLMLPAPGEQLRTPDSLQNTGPFAAVSEVSSAKATVALAGLGRPAYDVSSVSVVRAAPGDPLNLSFATSALPLLDAIFRAEGAATIPVVALSVQAGSGGPLLSHTFSRLSVSSFAENLSGSVSGTVTLVTRPK
jgi:hypothetical protein